MPGAPVSIWPRLYLALSLHERAYQRTLGSWRPRVAASISLDASTVVTAAAWPSYMQKNGKKPGDSDSRKMGLGSSF